MRAVFGLAGLLIVLGVVVMIMSKYLEHGKTVMDAGKKATEQAQQFAGRDSEGRDVRKTFSVDADDALKMTGVIVTSIEPGSALEKFYGLKTGDIVVEIQSRPVKEMATAAEAKDFIADSYARGQPLVIVRDEQRMTVPAPSANAAPPKPKDSLQGQLDAIQKIPTH